MNRWALVSSERARLFVRMASVAAVTLGLSGCGSKPGGGETDELAAGPIPTRTTTVEIDGCVLDPWQSETLAAGTTRKVVQEVLLMCLAPREDGSVAPSDPSARDSLVDTTASLHALGYTVRLGVSFTDETGARFDGVQTAQWLAQANWRASVASAIASHASEADGFDLDVERLPDTARDDLTTFVSGLSTALAAVSRRTGIFVLPSTRAPSDVDGGDAFYVASLAPLVDRIRVATLDFSVGSPGPTVDSGWAVDALTFASDQAAPGSVTFDIAAPLYGWDFSGTTQRSVTWLEATGLADEYRATTIRLPGGEAEFEYDDEYGVFHTVVYDDAQSTTDFLHAWDTTTVPSSVGVVLWGFGAEDPATFAAIAKATP